MSQRSTSTKNFKEENSYQASEELYEVLFVQAADGIFIADEQGHCIDVNQHGCKMLGYSLEELLGASMEDLVPAEDLARDPIELDEMRAGKILLKERRLRCKSGRFLPVEISARMLTDGRFLSIVRDISERRQAEEQLRESNERFQLLAESSLTGIYLIQENIFRYVNPAMAQIFGYEVEEIIDKLGPMDMVYPDDRPLVTENLRHRIDGEEEAIHYDFLGLRKDGSTIDIEVYGRRIEYSGKNGVIGTLMDVTKRKQTEEALRHNRETALQFSDQLATLQEVTNQLSKAESSDDLLRQAVQLGRSRLGFDRVSIWFIEEHLGIMRGSFGTNEQGKLRDERNTQVEFKHEGLAWHAFSQKEPMALVEQISLHDHLGQEVGEGENAVAALWDGGEVVGVIFVDNLFSRKPIGDHRLEILRLYATTLGHLITRKQAEEALRTSEERLQMALDAAQMGQWDWNITTGEVTWSPQCLALYGLPPDTQMNNERFLQALHPEDRERVDVALSQAVKERTGYEEQKRAVWPDGSVHWTASRGQVYCDAVGEPVRMTGVTFDISKWKEAEEAYRASVNRFRELFNKAAMPLCFVNKEDETLQFNGHFEKTFGYSQEEIPTLDEWWQLAYPDPAYRKWVIDTCAAALQRAIDTGSDIEPIEYRVTCKNGDIRTMVVYGGFIDDDLLLTFFDITEHKRAEQERQAHLRFLESLDQVNRAIQGTNDLDQMMRDVLDIVLDIFGCDRSNLVYPCDPNAGMWQASMERARPEYRGVFGTGQTVATDSEVAELFRILLNSGGPVRFGPQSEYPLLSNAEEEYGLKSFLGIALYPKVGSPWLFGLHQCAYPRVWTPEEERLFQEIGRRLADALTSLLAHRNLRESERKLAEAERIAHVGWWDRDYEADSITLSDEGRRIFGLPSKEDLQDLDLNQWHDQWKKLIHPEDRPRTAQAAEEALRGGPRYDLEYRVVRPEGEVRFIRSEGDITWDESGQPQRMFGIMQDITELRQAEDELRASEARFRTLVDHAADAFYLHDAKGTILDVNQQACQSLGYSREELIGKIPKEFDAVLDRSFLNQLEAQLDSGEEVEFETRHRRKDGTEFPVEVRGRPFWQGGQRFSVALVRDISERKQAQEALTLFRTLIDHTNDVIEVIDPETGRFLDANKQAWLTLGYSREEFLNLCVSDVNPRVAELSWQKMLGELREFGSIVRESQHQHKDGSIFPVEININYIHLDRDYILAVVRDITKRKQVEEALRESEERLRQIASSLREAVWLRDAQTRQVLYVNPAFQELTGRTCKSFYEDRELIKDAVHPDDKEWVNEALDQRFESIPFGKEHRIIHLDGSVRWVWSQIFPVRNEEGAVYRWASIMEDITERKQAEEALRASEERYRALYRDNPSMFFTLDSEGMIISVNTFGASQLGYTIDELEGRSILDLFFEDDQTAVTNQLQRCIQNPGQITHWQFRKVRKDGSLLWVEEFARTITDPNGTFNILVVCQDITDRKQAEIEQKRLLAQIREQAQQVQNIIDTVPEGVILLSKDLSVTLTNPVAREFLTLLTPEVQNGRLTHLGQRPLPELLTSPPKGLWHEITTEDLIFEAITRPVENGPENGGWVLVLRDITQERDIQQRVQRQERLAAVGQLAAGIAHDFNNILAVIALYTQLISRTVEMPEPIQERLHTIEQQIKRATDLIQQILDFGRQSILERQPLDLITFMEKLVTLLERTLPEHIQIELVYSAEAYFIQADSSRIQQVIMNLAVNARDAMPEGGNLTIRLAHVQTGNSKPMPVQDLPPGNWIQIEVIDSGDGIPQETLSHIFEPFFTTKGVGEGTGLGLAQVYGIVQQHDGYIDVTTKVGQGTTFFLYFPALNTGTNATEISDRVALQFGQGQQILLVEDNQATREALRDSLDQLNYEVLAATNGREALAILETQASEVDLVLSDVVMPEMGGVALFHAMQAHNLTIPMMLLTGHPLSNEMEYLKSMGLAGWLPKPLDLVNLSYLLAEILAT